MSRASTLILIGILTVLVPFSGLPSSIRSLLAVVLGTCVLGIGLALRAHDVRRTSSKTSTPSEPASPQEISPI